MTGYAVASRRTVPAGVWGMGILIASEAALFGALIATYFYLRFHTADWPPAGIPEPAWIGPTIAVAILASTSIPMHLARRAARAGRASRAAVLVGAAFVVQAAYFAFVAHDFHDQLQSNGIGENAYTSIYYTLLGADHAHVFAGLLLDLWLLGKLARGLTKYRVNATWAIAWYWHFVNVLSIVVLATVLTARI